MAGTAHALCGDEWMYQRSARCQFGMEVCHPEGDTQSAEVPVRRLLGHLWKVMGNGQVPDGRERELSDVNTNNPGSGWLQPSSDPQGALGHILLEEEG